MGSRAGKLEVRVRDRCVGGEKARLLALEGVIGGFLLHGVKHHGPMLINSKKQRRRFVAVPSNERSYASFKRGGCFPRRRNMVSI